MAVEVAFDNQHYRWQVGMRDGLGRLCWLRDEHGNIADVTQPYMPRHFNHPSGNQLLERFARVDAKFQEMTR